ncbi:MAG: DUF3293 domain-containing protein [Betaproteobacteria bacterium]|nr:DUF3293 domain-containing protein [Betaproteobacteria bacterium]
MTACNPFSQDLDPAENHRRQVERAKEIGRRGLEYLDGVGQHPCGD